MSVWTPFQFGDQFRLALVAGGDALEQVRFEGSPLDGVERDDGLAVLREASAQLLAYFRGELQCFELPLKPKGTVFQKRVWEALLTIPYGETRSYSEIAAQIGAATAVRAVGAANGQNPIPIIVPCHRVIGRSGKLVGFGGGLPMKKLLLELESKQQGWV